MPKTTDQINTTTEREAFVLELPAVFKVTPDHIVALPRKWQAWIYITPAGSVLEDGYGKLRTNSNNEAVLDPRPYYRVRIITPKGKPSRNFHYHGGHEPIGVAEFIQGAADKLSIKTVEQKRIKREEGNYEDEE